jgi:hypothetical protein
MSELPSRVTCKLAAIQQACEHGNREITIVGSCYLATCGEDTDAFTVWSDYL